MQHSGRNPGDAPRRNDPSSKFGVEVRDAGLDKNELARIMLMPSR
jgi:hypothetical protein